VFCSVVVITICLVLRHLSQALHAGHPRCFSRHGCPQYWSITLRDASTCTTYVLVPIVIPLLCGHSDIIVNSFVCALAHTSTPIRNFVSSACANISLISRPTASFCWGQQFRPRFKQAMTAGVNSINIFRLRYFWGFNHV